MSGYLFDSSVLLDLATADPHWCAWSEAQFRSVLRSGLVLINPIIYAEIAPAFASANELELWLDPKIFGNLPLPYDAGWRAAEAFIQYRWAGGTRSSPLPDFYIGAHAEVKELTLVTRDVSRFHTYFPSITIISP